MLFGSYRIRSIWPNRSIFESDWAVIVVTAGGNREPVTAHCAGDRFAGLVFVGTPTVRAGVDRRAIVTESRQLATVGISAWDVRAAGGIVGGQVRWDSTPTISCALVVTKTLFYWIVGAASQRLATRERSPYHRGMSDDLRWHGRIRRRHSRRQGGYCISEWQDDHIQGSECEVHAIQGFLESWRRRLGLPPNCHRNGRSMRQSRLQSLA